MVENSCQFVSGGDDGFWSSQFGPHSPIILTEVRVAVMRELSANRNASAARLFTFLVLAESICPPLIWLWGHKPNHEANAEPVFNFDQSGPIEISGMCVRCIQS